MFDRSDSDLAESELPALVSTTTDDINIHPLDVTLDKQRHQRRLAPLPPKRYAAQRHNASNVMRRFFSVARHQRKHWGHICSFTISVKWLNEDDAIFSHSV